MKESAIDEAVRSAERARKELVANLQELTSVGQEWAQKLRGQIGKAALIGLGAVGGVVLIAAALRGRRASRRVAALQQRHAPRSERSFAADAFRSVALSVLGVVAARLARRLPLPGDRA